MTELRIVLVDDSVDECALAVEAFAEFAPDLELTTLSCRDALFAHLDQEILPHLVLLDLHLGLDMGSDIARQLKQHAAHMVPVVILTTTDDDLERGRCLAAGALDFWVKPGHFADYPGLLNRARELASLCHQSELQTSLRLQE